MREYLLAFSPQIAETTVLPPTVLGAISAALDLIPDMQLERKNILHESECLRSSLSSMGWDTRGQLSYHSSFFQF